MPVLLRPYQISRSAYLQITHRNFKTRAELGKLFHCEKPLFRLLCQLFVARKSKICVCQTVASAYPSAQLIHLCKPESVGVFDNNCIDVRNVKPRFYYGCAYQDVNLALRYLHHYCLYFGFVHSSVNNRNPCVRHNLCKLVRRLVNSVNPVKEIIDLTSARKLAFDCLADYKLVIFHHICFNRVSVARRLIDYTHIPDTAQRHMKRSRYRRGGKRQNIDIVAHFLDFFFMTYTKTLFFIYNQKSKLVKLYSLAEKLVRSYNYVCLSGCKLFNCVFLLRCCTEPRQHSYLYGIIHHSLLKCVKMLIGKNGCRNKICYLISAHTRFKRGTQSNLCLSVTNVSAQKSVHRVRLFHILFNLVYTSQLVIGFVIGECRLKALLPFRVGFKAYSGGIGALCIKGNKLFCHFLGCSLYPLLCFGPVAPSEAVKPDRRPFFFVIAVNHIKLVRRNIKHIAVFIRNFKVVPANPLNIKLLCPKILSDTVVAMNNIITRVKCGKIRNSVAFFSSVKRLSSAFSLSAEDFSVAYYRKANQGIFKSLADRTSADNDSAARRQLFGSALVRA